jgi:hypothetical protein
MEPVDLKLKLLPLEHAPYLKPRVEICIGDV